MGLNYHTMTDKRLECLLVVDQLLIIEQIVLLFILFNDFDQL